MSDTKPISVLVDFDKGNSITSTFPTGYIRNQTPLLGVNTNKKANCRINIDNAWIDLETSDNKIHTYRIRNNLVANTYNYDVSCAFPYALGSGATSKISFTVDLEDPTPPSINGSKYTCDNKSFTNKLVFSGTDNNGVSGYEYKIIGPGPSDIVRNYTSSNNQPSIRDLNLEDDREYKLYARTVDVAGRYSVASAEFKFQVYSKDKDVCKDKGAPSVFLTTSNTNRGLMVSMDCNDENGCNIQKYLVLSEFQDICDSCSECSNTNYIPYTTPVYEQSKDFTFCYYVTDNLGNERYGESHLFWNGTRPNPTQNFTTQPKTFDMDNDGMENIWEANYSGCGLSDNVYKDRYYDLDSDGLFNIEEYKAGSDPCIDDTDQDGILDGGERTSSTDILSDEEMPVDTDDDAIDDVWEQINFGTLSFDEDLDTDFDGLSDYQEYLYNTNPKNTDTDQDGLSDGVEVKEHRTWPNSIDTDNDGYNDYTEIDKGTDPLDPEKYPLPERPIEDKPIIEDNEPVKSVKILPLILLIIGLLLILGGSGYLLYKYYFIEKNQKTQKTQSPTLIQQKTQITPTLQGQTKIIQQTNTSITKPVQSSQIQKPNTQINKFSQNMMKAKRLFESKSRQKRQNRRDFLSAFDEKSRSGEDKESASLSAQEFTKKKGLKPKIVIRNNSQQPQPVGQVLQQQKTIIDTKPKEDDYFKKLDNVSKEDKLYVDKLDSIIGTNTKKPEDKKIKDIDQLEKIINEKNVKSTDSLDKLGATSSLKKLEELSSSKDLKPKQIFETLGDIVKDKKAKEQITEITQKRTIKKDEIMQTLSALASQPKILDIQVFKVVLSKLLETDKISKSDISSMLVDMEKGGAITKDQTLKIMRELNIK